MSKMQMIWSGRDITKTTKMRLVRALIFLIFLYGVETWTLTASKRKRNARDPPWTAMCTNVSILGALASTIGYRLSAYGVFSDTLEMWKVGEAEDDHRRVGVTKFHQERRCPQLSTQRRTARSGGDLFTKEIGVEVTVPSNEETI